ncbi:MAG: DUF2075 domain-containing protein [Proteobacteria bacterium]|nr:DUF2075 domain-containing protein [Pseudomonadota bacterium]
MWEYLAQFDRITNSEWALATTCGALRPQSGSASPRLQVNLSIPCQGLELDYVGVVIGEDLVIRDGRVVTDAGKRSSQDRSIRGYKSMLKSNPDAAQALADRIIKNTYRTLMTRGQKGCYLFCVDGETNEYFRRFVEYGGRQGGSEFQWLKAAEPGPPDDDTPGGY